MSQIPSDIPASAAQAGFQANDVAKEREARRAGQSYAASRQVKAIDEAETIVDTDDADVAVFSDAEGGGSEGREMAEEPSEESSDNCDASGKGITTDGDGQVHVDLEA